MIKLTEVVANPGSYSPSTGMISNTYSLKSLYVNPSFVVEVRENEEMSEVHACKEIINGLTPEAAFTKIVVAAGGNWTRIYNVVGQPEHIVSSFRQEAQK